MSHQPGEDCPRCGAPLGVSGCLTCHWQPASADIPSSSCKGCVREKQESGAFCVTRCHRCGDHSPSTGPFHPDDLEADPQDRGVRLCPSCWIPALKRRAARCVHGQLCVRCSAQIALDRAEFRDHMRKVEVRSISL